VAQQQPPPTAVRGLAAARCSRCGRAHRRHSDRPHVARLGVWRAVALKPGEHLGGGILGRAGEPVERLAVLLPDRRVPKVDQHQPAIPRVVDVAHHQVFGLDVAVDDALLVQRGERAEELRNQPARASLL
jgi:hypothetical protein